MDSLQEHIIVVGDTGSLAASALAEVKERQQYVGAQVDLLICDDCQEEDNGAVGILEEAAECIGDRASERDTEEERSMAATVRAFNGMFGTEITEEQGWHFMALLKMARTKGGDFRRDDYVDGAAYFALAGECRGNE